MKTQQIQKLTIGVLAVIILVLFYLLNGAGNVTNQQEYDKVLLQDSIKSLKNIIAFERLKAGVLNDLNGNLAEQIYTENNSHVKIQSEPISAEAKAVQNMIVNMESGWVKMMEKKDPDELLVYFLPEYTTNSVKIDTRKMPFVQRHNDTNFRKQLQNLVETKELSFSFTQPKFYSTMVRDNIFTSSYLSNLTTMHEGKVVQKCTILCFVSGEKKNGKWLIGNYNWTRYDDYDASENVKKLTL
jgi:hypothetical protein